MVRVSVLLGFAILCIAASAAQNGGGNKPGGGNGGGNKPGGGNGGGNKPGGGGGNKPGGGGNKERVQSRL